jgi:hypothetical protein
MQNIYFQSFPLLSLVTVASLSHSTYQSACSSGTDSNIVTDIWHWIRRNEEGLPTEHNSSQYVSFQS